MYIRELRPSLTKDVRDHLLVYSHSGDRQRFFRNMRVVLGGRDVRIGLRSPRRALSALFDSVSPSPSSRHAKGDHLHCWGVRWDKKICFKLLSPSRSARRDFRECESAGTGEASVEGMRTARQKHRATTRLKSFTRDMTFTLHDPDKEG